MACERDQLFSITVFPYAVSCGNPPNGKIGVPYSHTLPVVGGVPPYDFVVTAGVLPSGLALLSPAGTIEGTPQQAGKFTFTIQVTDSNGQIALGVECSIFICPVNAQGV